MTIEPPIPRKSPSLGGEKNNFQSATQQPITGAFLKRVIPSRHHGIQDENDLQNLVVHDSDVS